MSHLQWFSGTWGSTTPVLASINVHRQEIVTLAQNVARAYIDKDILYRSWNAFHGGIYIDADKGVSPNPYLPPTLPERDVITPSGRHLTLVNPAYCPILSG